MQYIHTYTHTDIHTYMHTYRHTYIHTCIPAYLHTCVHAYMHTCMHTYKLTNLQTYIHTCMHTYMHTYLHACRHTYIHDTYIHTYTHRHVHYIHTHIHTYIHACMHACMHAGRHAYMRFEDLLLCCLPNQKLSSYEEWNQYDHPFASSRNRLTTTPRTSKPHQPNTAALGESEGTTYPAQRFQVESVCQKLASRFVTNLQRALQHGAHQVVHMPAAVPKGPGPETLLFQANSGLCRHLEMGV